MADKRFGEFVARYLPEGEYPNGYFFGGYLYRGHLIEWNPHSYGYDVAPGVGVEGLCGRYLKRFHSVKECVEAIDEEMATF